MNEMKIGGRIIQNKKIRINDSKGFSAHYKGHLIDVCIYKEYLRANTEWSVVVISPSGSYACNTTIQRCTIRDAVIYALNESLL